MSDVPDTIMGDHQEVAAMPLLSALKILFAEPGAPDQASWRVEPASHGDVPSQASGSAWFGATNGLLFRIEKIAGNPVFYTDSQISEAAAILDDAAMILQACEARLGYALEPQSLSAALPDGYEAYAITYGDDGSETRIGLAFAPDVDHAAHAQAQVAQLPHMRTSTPCRSTLILACPALDVDAAAALGVGDMLLLNDFAPARIVPDALDGIAAWNSINDGTGLPDGVVSFAGLSFTAGAVPEAPVAGGFLITPMLCIPDVVFPYGVLLRLQAGDVLQLPPLSSVGPVRLMLGDSVIAHGSVSQSVQACGFIIDTMAQSAQDHPAGNPDTANPDENPVEAEADHNAMADMADAISGTSSPIRQAG